MTLFFFFYTISVFLQMCKTSVPSCLRDNHLGAEFVELLPEFLCFEVTLNASQLAAIRVCVIRRGIVNGSLGLLERPPLSRVTTRTLGDFDEFLCNIEGKR